MMYSSICHKVWNFFSIFLWSALKLGNVRKEFGENAATSITTFEISSMMPSFSSWGRVSLWLRRRFHVLKVKKLLLLYWFGVSPEPSRMLLERCSALYWGSANKVQDWGLFSFFLQKCLLLQIFIIILLSIKHFFSFLYLTDAFTQACIYTPSDVLRTRLESSLYSSYMWQKMMSQR